MLSRTNDLGLRAGRRGVGKRGWGRGGGVVRIRILKEENSFGVRRSHLVHLFLSKKIKRFYRVGIFF